MKYSLIFFMLASIYVSPHLNVWLAIALGVWCLCMAIYCMRGED